MPRGYFVHSASWFLSISRNWVQIEPSRLRFTKIGPGALRITW
jgi:hypothetical protein